MYPHLLCIVDVMISTLQKRLQDALLSLVGPSSSFRIGSHLGRDTVQRPLGGGSCQLSQRRWLLSGWWVGNGFPRRLLPTQARHSSAKGLLTRREILMNLARRPRVSAEIYPQR